MSAQHLKQKLKGGGKRTQNTGADPSSEGGPKEPSATRLASVSTGKVSARNGLSNDLVTPGDLSRRAGISCLAVSLGIFNICCHLHTCNYVLIHVNRNSYWQLLLIIMYCVMHALFLKFLQLCMQDINIISFIFIIFIFI